MRLVAIEFWQGSYKFIVFITGCKMAIFRKFLAPRCAFATLAVLLVPSVQGQDTAPATGGAPLPAASSQGTPVRPRITSVIDDAFVAPVRHSTHPMAVAANDRGRADGNLSLERIMLLLQPSEQQQADLTKLIDS